MNTEDIAKRDEEKLRKKIESTAKKLDFYMIYSKTIYSSFEGILQDIMVYKPCMSNAYFNVISELSPHLASNLDYFSQYQDNVAKMYQNLSTELPKYSLGALNFIEAHLLYIAESEEIFREEVCEFISINLSDRKIVTLLDFQIRAIKVKDKPVYIQYLIILAKSIFGVDFHDFNILFQEVKLIKTFRDIIAGYENSILYNRLDEFIDKINHDPKISDDINEKHKILGRIRMIEVELEYRNLPSTEVNMLNLDALD